jgi:hypothetical protein
MTLYPDMSLADACIRAREKRAILDKRCDPLLEKQVVVEQLRTTIAAQNALGTLRELAEDWYGTEVEGRRLKHPRVRQHLDNYLLSEFGDRYGRRSCRPLHSA